MYNFEFDVPVNAFEKDAAKLMYEHWQEIGINKEKIKLNPDFTKYAVLQNAGVLKNIVVYKDEKAIGYSVIFLEPNLHYSDHVFGKVDIIYVSKEHRNSSVGARLLVATETLAKYLGCSVLIHHAKPHADMIVKPLEKLGYSLQEYLYGKYLGE